MAKFNCPNCGHVQVVDDKHVGRSATCPKCKTQGTVEETPAGDRHAGVNTAEGASSVRRDHGEPLGIDKLLKNAESTLRHEWIVIDDPRMTVRFDRVCGVTPSWDLDKSTEYHRAYYYKCKFRWMSGDVALSAVEFRFLTFDVWGEHVRTLCTTTIKDFAPQARSIEDSKWALFSENEAWEHFASIGYVARVRTTDGRVILADTEMILREAQRFTEKFTEADLEPKAPQKGS